ncbi:Calcineurin-like metallo-phosphoesterase superfamily protein isoform 1 [Dorcoceras hygrometricum]|uniref:Calcineurin-like metallo-phosphoesterase superfamily protein isoform 1 n=1 Tax=Dorcoceras hygrometricum TaxID=472368 RepID=A0A2Z7B9V7_9LAMI|nr:Calcineurin-like metallo-phosphoesterase superfamily protein isoform 1 [Dorcoceras hygrometricum]
MGATSSTQVCPTLITQQKALNKAQDGIFNTYPTSYLNGRRNPTLMLTDYRREMSSHTSPASRKRNTYPTSYLNGRRNPTLMLTDYRREMSSHTSPASRKRPKEVSNEASQQEESNATTLTSIGGVYRRQSEKIRFDEQQLGYRGRVRYREMF